MRAAEKVLRGRWARHMWRVKSKLWLIPSEIANLFEEIFRKKPFKIAKDMGLLSLLEML